MRRYLEKVGPIWMRNCFHHGLWHCEGRILWCWRLWSTTFVEAAIAQKLSWLLSSFVLQSQCDLPRAAGSAGAPLLYCGSFKGKLFDVNGLTPDWESRLFCANILAYQSTRADPSSLCDGERAMAPPPPLGFKSLFQNNPLPWCASWPAFWILSATRICSFSLEICCASKFVAQFVFTIKLSWRKQLENVHEPKEKRAAWKRGGESQETPRRVNNH